MQLQAAKRLREKDPDLSSDVFKPLSSGSLSPALTVTAPAPAPAPAFAGRTFSAPAAPNLPPPPPPPGPLPAAPSSPSMERPRLASPLQRKALVRSRSPRREASGRLDYLSGALLRKHDGTVDFDIESQESFI